MKLAMMPMITQKYQRSAWGVSLEKSPSRMGIGTLMFTPTAELWPSVIAVKTASNAATRAH